jgi:hypothetical protein
LYWRFNGKACNSDFEVDHLIGEIGAFLTRYSKGHFVISKQNNTKEGKHYRAKHVALLPQTADSNDKEKPYPYEVINVDITNSPKEFSSFEDFVEYLIQANIITKPIPNKEARYTGYSQYA